MLKKFICLALLLLAGRAAVAGVTVPEDYDLTLQSPRDYQVFQRRTMAEGPVLVSGRVRADCDGLQVHLTGGSGDPQDLWESIAVDKVAHSFNAVISVPAGGWYAIEVIALRRNVEVKRRTIEHVGVGEVFVGAGQSNSTNCGEGSLKTETGMVSTYDGSRWRLANDPQPGVHDESTGGSFWPVFGDTLYNNYKVPIGVAVTGQEATSVSDWQRGGELFDWTLTRIRELGPQGFRALLWHQGEDDVSMSSNRYAELLTTLIRDSKRAAGWEFPWMVAQVSYRSPSNPSSSSTRDAQQALWEAGVALQGPDTDTLTGDNRSDNGKGIHFSVKGLKAHGLLWAEKVAQYLNAITPGVASVSDFRGEHYADQ